MLKRLHRYRRAINGPASAHDQEPGSNDESGASHHIQINDRHETTSMVGSAAEMVRATPDLGLLTPYNDAGGPSSPSSQSKHTGISGTDSVSWYPAPDVR
jgi:hypothetical protein